MEGHGNPTQISDFGGWCDCRWCGVFTQEKPGINPNVGIGGPVFIDYGEEILAKIEEEREEG